MSSAIDYFEVDISSFGKSSYYDYSMYVIEDRALPNIRDGLKPVQRRILYAMSELGLHHHNKYKKSARTIGDVIGKFHPHGDSACYEAMAMMTQSFSYRYPLIDGQGNWGSQDDPKSFAAMRYTESRLTSYTDLLLSEIKTGSTVFVENFDQTIFEPKYFPSRVPNILLNGSTGIAVSMATDVAPHNIKEVLSAIKLMLDNPSVSLSSLMDVMPGPDYPTGGLIVSTKENLRSIYETGRGSVILRASYVVENKTDIVITTLPYRVSGEKVMMALGELMTKKKLSMVEDIRDESDHENPVRIVISVGSSYADKINSVVDHIFSVTDLQISKKINFNILGLDNKPSEMPLVKILKDWISYRKECLLKTFSARINKIKNRLHLIDGLIICYLNIDEVIRIIREEKNPHESLKLRFELTDEQATYILDTRLRSLAKLEEMELRKEMKSLNSEMNDLNKLISSDKKMSEWIKADLDSILASFADDRRCEIKSSVATAEKLDFTPSEPITVIVSKNGWIRSGKGHQIAPAALQYKVGDSFGASLQTSSNVDTVLFDSKGRSYVIQNDKLPSAKSFGDPLSAIISLEPGAEIVDMFRSNLQSNRFVASSDGYGFICQHEDFLTKQKKGKQIINCDKYSSIQTSQLSDGDDYICLITNNDMVAIVSLGDFDVMKKGRGLKIADIHSGDSLKSITPFNSGAALIFEHGSGAERLTFSKYSQFIIERGRKPKKLPKSMAGLRSISVEVK